MGVGGRYLPPPQPTGTFTSGKRPEAVQTKSWVALPSSREPRVLPGPRPGPNTLRLLSLLSTSSTKREKTGRRTQVVLWSREEYGDLKCGRVP